MKLNKKKILVVSLVLSLVAILSFGSLAWFNDTASVTNTFKVATSEDSDGQDLFGVLVYENKVNENGKKIDGQWVYSNDTPNGNTYERVLPNATYDKTATVTNTGKYDEYIRVCVTFNKGATWLNICNQYGIAPNSIYDVMDGWVLTDTIQPTVENGNQLTYVYYLNRRLEHKTATSLAAKTNYKRVFEKVTIPAQFTQQDLSYLDGEFNLTVKADAVQADALPVDVILNDADAAKEAFTAIKWAPMTAYDYEP